MTHLVLKVTVCSMLMCLVACNYLEDTLAKKPADTIYTGGIVITMDDDAPVAEALATRDGLIIAVGSNKKIAKFKGANTRIVSLDQQVLVPGFIDAYSHFSLVSLYSAFANLLPAPEGFVNSIADLQDTLRKYLETSQVVQDYGVVIGVNYDDSQLLEQRDPTRHDLDAVSSEIPIVLIHQYADKGVYNTKALEQVGISAESTTPQGGVIERELDGKTPRGVLKKSAHANALSKLMPIFTAADMAKLYKAGQQVYLANGFTTVQEGKASSDSINSMSSSAEIQPFALDVVAYADIANLKDLAVLRTDLMSGEYRKGFRIGGLALTLDGSSQDKTAWLTQPYFKPPDSYKPVKYIHNFPSYLQHDCRSHSSPDSQGYVGYAAFSDSEAKRWVDLALANHWQLLVHANGDAAVQQLIDGVSRSLKKYPREGHRTRLIKGQFIRRDQVQEIINLGIHPAFFPMHTFYWGDWHYESVAGPNRAENLSPAGWFLERGYPFSMYSDAPLVPQNSMRILDSAVNRLTRSERVLGNAHQLSPLDALKSMTLWPAYQLFEEHLKGSIEVGKQADFVILDSNPLEVNSSEIKDIRVVKTINDDRVVFSL